MLATRINRTFWELYALGYDYANRNYLHAQLDEEVVELLSVKNGDLILDCGCGTGILYDKLLKSNENFKIIGVDLSSRMIEKARKNCSKDMRCDFLVSDIDRPLKFPNSSFNKIIAIHSLYAANDLKFTIQELMRVLKKNGELIIVNPKGNSNIFKQLSEEIKLRDSFWGSVYFILSTFPIALLNMVIFIKGRKRSYNFIDTDKFTQILELCSLKVVQAKDVYAGQSSLIRAIK